MKKLRNRCTVKLEPFGNYILNFINLKDKIFCNNPLSCSHQPHPKCSPETFTLCWDWNRLHLWHFCIFKSNSFFFIIYTKKVNNPTYNNKNTYNGKLPPC